MFYGFFLGVCFLVFKLCNRFEVLGTENIKEIADGKAGFFAANHASAIDCYMLAAALYFPYRRRISPLTRSVWINHPYAGFFLRSCDAIALDKRGRYSLLGAIRESQNRLDKGVSVVGCPEGIRTATGRLNELKGGLPLIAVKTKAPVIPVWLGGSFRALPAGACFLRSAKLYVEFGRPIDPEELPAELTDKEKTALILEKLNEFYREREARDIKNGILKLKEN